MSRSLRQLRLPQGATFVVLVVLPVARPLHRRARSLDLCARLSHPLIVVLVCLSVY